MKTLTVDDYQRVRLPDVEPRSKFAYVNNGDGTLTLTAVKAEVKQAFPRGSLLPYIDDEWNKEVSALAKGSSLRLPD